MAFMDFLFGKKAEEKTKPIFNPEQMGYLSQLAGGVQPGIGAGLQNLQNILGGSKETFDTFAAPARRAFEQQTLPTIAERFTGQFGPGSERSSAFGQALGQAGKELEEDIFSQRIGMQSQAFQQLIPLLQMLMAPREYQYMQPRQPGFLENIGTAAAEGFAKVLPLMRLKR